MENQNILQAMFWEATIGILAVDVTGKIVKINPFAEKMFGYDKGELMGKQLEMLLPESFRSTHTRHRQNYHKNPEPRLMGSQLELFGIRKNGSQIPVEISLSYVQMNNEQLALAYINDVSVLKKAEMINKDISKIVEDSLNEVFIFDAETLHFIQVNKGARNNIGYTLEEMEQMTPVDIKPYHTEESFGKLVEPLMTGEKEIIKFETVHQRKNNTNYPVEVHLQLSSIGGRSVYVAIILDITEDKKAELELHNLNAGLEEKIKERTRDLRKSEKKLKKALTKEQELGELKSRFVSMASHEFRTPLSSILSSASLIGLYPESEQQEKRMKHVNRINASVENLTTILNDFLSLEKLESGKISCQNSEVDFVIFAESVLEEIKISAHKNQEIIHKHLGKRTAMIDEHLVKNILLNLLSNAVKYSPDGENIDLISEIKNGSLLIKVRDRGIGIPKVDQEYMFSRFFRATNVTAIQGTGLGLTIVKRYLDLMSGIISFESKENEGTTFLIEIPQ